MATLKLYADDRGRMVETTDPDADVVEFSPQGGGFVYKMGHGVFHNTFKPATMPEFHEARFGGDWLPGDLILKGYTDGSRWNGWACPHFSKEEGLRLAEASPALRYDEARDAFVDRPIVDEDDIEEVFSSETITVAGQPLKVYAIGAGSWCWDEV